VFFRGEDELDQLVKISKVLGTDELYAYAEKYGVDLDPKLVQLCGYRWALAGLGSAADVLQLLLLCGLCG
jgi:casein kinase II subunit alpha